MDLLQGPRIYESLFDFKETESLNLTFEQFEYGNLNFLMNSGSMGIAVFLVIIYFFVFMCLDKSSKRNYRSRTCRKVGIWSKGKIEFRIPLLTMLVEGYIDVTISAYLGMVALYRSYEKDELIEWFSNPTDGFLATITILTFITVIIIPFYINWRLTSNFEQLDNEEFRETYGVYYDDYKIETKT